jgi:hypothetical protein
MGMSRRFLGILLCFTLLATDSLTAWGDDLVLGKKSLGVAKAPTLHVPGPLRMRSARFVARVGGVAFGQVAAPSASLRVKSLTISYDAGLEDCQRLVLHINERRVFAPVCDWVLIPTAAFADDPEDQAALVTAFGRLDDEKAAKLVTENKGYVFNYHPAIVDTLLGLRLMQADLLLIDDNTADLPQKQGRYLLGRGETEPNIRAQTAAWMDVAARLHRLTRRHGPFRSYVLGDDAVPVSFDANSGRLSFTGEPTYRFWRYRSDARSHREVARVQKLMARETRKERSRYEEARRRGGPAFDGRAWLSARIVQLGSDVLDDLNEPEFRQMLASASLEELLKLLDEIAPISWQRAVVLLDKEFSTLWKEQSPRSLNRAVFDAATQTMRYAAFFRYVRRNHPGSWAAFRRGIKDVRPLPAVKTPTTVQ